MLKTVKVLFSFFAFFLLVISSGLSAESSREEIKEQLLGLGYDVFRVSNGGDNVLHLAAKKQNLEVVELILAYGIDPSRVNKAGDTPLHIAAGKGNLPICQLLVEAGSAITLRNNLGQTPYHKALAKPYEEILQFFEEYGFQPGDDFEDHLLALSINPEHMDAAGNTWLHRLAKVGNLELMNAALQHGHDPFVYNKKMETPLSIAVKRKDLEMTQLLAGYRKQEKTLISFEDLILATKANWAEGLEFLLSAAPHLIQRIDHCDSKGISLIHYGCAEGNLEIVQLLIEFGSDVNKLTQSEYRYGPTDPYYWSSHDWDVWAEVSYDSDMFRYEKDSGYLHPVVSPLAIVRYLHPNNVELQTLLVEHNAQSYYCDSIRNESLEQYLH